MLVHTQPRKGFSGPSEKRRAEKKIREKTGKRKENCNSVRELFEKAVCSHSRVSSFNAKEEMKMKMNSAHTKICFLDCFFFFPSFRFNLIKLVMALDSCKDDNLDSVEMENQVNFMHT